MIFGRIGLNRRIAGKTDGKIVETPQHRAANIICRERVEYRIIMINLVLFGVRTVGTRTTGGETKLLQHQRLARFRFIHLQESGEIAGFIVKVNAIKIEIVVQFGKIFSARPINPADGLQLIPIQGFNYYPRLHPWHTFNQGEWDPVTTERELKLGASLGANVVRLFVDYNFSIDLKTPQPTPTFFAPVQWYIDNVRQCVDLCGRLGLKVILTLFDSLDWAIYQPQNRWIAEEYLKLIVPPFVNDPRILCWDLQNEPDRAIAQVGANIVIPFFQRLSLLTRALDRNQLQTIGWIDRARGKYFSELDNYLDFYCIHFYDKASNLADLLQMYKTKTRKPLMLQEFGLATGGPGSDGANTEQDQVNHYDTILNTLVADNLCGSVLWCLNDFPIGLAGNPPIQTDSPENHFGVFRLDYSEKPVTTLLRNRWLNQLQMTNH